MFHPCLHIQGVFFNATQFTYSESQCLKGKQFISGHPSFVYIIIHFLTYYVISKIMVVEQ